MSKIRDGLFKHGIVVLNRDNERGHNEGLSKREIKALEEENTSPWGRKSLRNSAIRGRAEKGGHK